MIVAINKLDTVNWSKERFDEIMHALRGFLQKNAGFSSLTFIPLSGLSGENLTKKCEHTHPLSKWYNGQTLIEALGNRSLGVIICLFRSINPTTKNVKPTASDSCS